MAQTFVFPHTEFPAGPRPFTRSFGDKLQEIALRSPQDIAALERIADLVLRRLNADDRLAAEP